MCFLFFMKGRAVKGCLIFSYSKLILQPSFAGLIFNGTKGTNSHKILFFVGSGTLRCHMKRTTILSLSQDFIFPITVKIIAPILIMVLRNTENMYILIVI